jgi:hypothetical protein
MVSATKIHRGVLNVQTKWRAHQATVKTWALRRDHSVRKVQAVSRGYLVRKQIDDDRKTKEKAATAIQVGLSTRLLLCVSCRLVSSHVVSSRLVSTRLFFPRTLVFCGSDDIVSGV